MGLTTVQRYCAARDEITELFLSNLYRYYLQARIVTHVTGCLSVAMVMVVGHVIVGMHRHGPLWVRSYHFTAVGAMHLLSVQRCIHGGYVGLDEPPSPT